AGARPAVLVPRGRAGSAYRVLVAVLGLAPGGSLRRVSMPVAGSVFVSMNVPDVLALVGATRFDPSGLMIESLVAQQPEPIEEVKDRQIGGPCVPLKLEGRFWPGVGIVS